MAKDSLDKFLKKLQNDIVEKEIEVYNEYIVKLFHNPKNWGKPSEEDISVSQSYTGPCGDTIQFFFKIKGNIIEKANFLTDGCGASVATASQTTLLIEGQSLDYAKKLKAKDLDNALHGLPDDHKHCAELAIRTLMRAIKKYEDREKKEG